MKIKIDEKDFIEKVYNLERNDSLETFEKLEKNKSFKIVAEFLIARTLYEANVK